MKTPVLVNEIVELQKISLEQSKIIEENEVHAASLVHELR